MKDLIHAARLGLLTKNYSAALFTALTIPDICAALENGKTSGVLYSAWWEKYMTMYFDYLSGNDAYALRCAMLHQGQSDITDQRAQNILEGFVFMTEGAHCNLFKDCIFKGQKKSILQLNVSRFCEDICTSAEKWLHDTANIKEVAARLQRGLEIHEPGYIHLGCIQFM